MPTQLSRKLLTIGNYSCYHSLCFTFTLSLERHVTISRSPSRVIPNVVTDPLFSPRPSRLPLSPVESALPQNQPLTPLESALTRKGGGGPAVRSHDPWSTAPTESRALHTKKAGQLCPASRSRRSYLNQKWHEATPRFCKYFW